MADWLRVNRLCGNFRWYIIVILSFAGVHRLKMTRAMLDNWYSDRTRLPLLEGRDR